jgi:hypothetical protein
VHLHLSSAARRLCAPAVAAIGALALGAPAAHAMRLTTVATGLNQPKKITVTAVAG